MNEVLSTISKSDYTKNYLSLSLKINLIGDTSVGKTSIIVQYIKKEFIETFETIGIECYKKEVIIEEYKFNLNIWDTAGQRIYRNLTKSSIRGVDILMIVFDVTNRNSFENLDIWYKDIVNFIDINKIIICIVANKMDISEKQEVLYDEYYNYSKSINAFLYEISAKNFDTVNQMFENSIFNYYHKFLMNNQNLGNLNINEENFALANKELNKKNVKVKHKCC
jgi:small GTP-binding protein